MDLRIDPDSPVPVYHQIAEALRYRIAVGALRPNDLLPSVRAAAERLGVHYLTVRKAYGALEDDGLLELRRGLGTRVVAGMGKGTGKQVRRDAEGLEAFVEHTVRTARTVFGVGPDELVHAIRRGTAVVARPAPGRAIHVVECNLPQCVDYAGQVGRALGADVGTWVLDRKGEPPAGLLIGTYFHFNDIRSRWSGRGEDLRFVAVRPDPHVVERIRAPGAGTPLAVRLCETDPLRADNVLPDLERMLAPAQIRIEPWIVSDLVCVLDEDDPRPALFSPRLWARLDEGQRSDPRAILLRYLVAPEDLEALAAEIAGAGDRAERAAS